MTLFFCLFEELKIRLAYGIIILHINNHFELYVIFIARRVFMRTATKITSIILSIFMLLGILCAAPLSVSAADSTSGTYKNVSYTISGNILTVSGTGATGGEFGERTPWLDYSDSITKIVVGEGITEISNSFFTGMGKVTSVSLPDSLKTLGQYAFSNNSSLEKIVFPNGLEKVDSMAFLYCKKLKSINFPKNCVFGSWAFDFCGFTSVAVPDSFEGELGGYCFCNNESLHIATIGKNTKKIGKGVFASCNDLNNLVVSSSNPYYTTKDNVLYNKDMTELLFYAPGKTNTKFTIPSGVKVIGENSFDRISTLTSIVIPEGVTTLKEAAFRNCENLAEISFPDSLENIESYALLKTAWLDNQPEGMIYVGKIAFKLKGDNTKVVRVKMGTKKIAAGCFQNCTKLTRVFLNASLTEIGADAFYGCESLNDVVIPDGVTELGDTAFYKCNSLTNLTIGKGLTKLEPFVFAMCEKLEEVEIPDNITEICEYAFHGDPAMKKLIVPASVKSIGSYAIGYYPANNKFFSNTNLTVYGYKKSSAENYCNNYRIKFSALDGDKIGDVNGDNSVDILDANAIQKYSVGKLNLSKDRLNLADVNDDGTVDIFDATDIEKYVVRKITEFKKK